MCETFENENRILDVSMLLTQFREHFQNFHRWLAYLILWVRWAFGELNNEESLRITVGANFQGA